MTLALLWQEYKAGNPDGYQYRANENIGAFLRSRTSVSILAPEVIRNNLLSLAINRDGTNKNEPKLQNYGRKARETAPQKHPHKR